METNILANKQHYNKLYEKTKVDDIIRKVLNYEAFLDDATRTDTSWHGMYYGDLRNQLAGRKVLELGCGDGLNALIMASLGAKVTALDISDVSEYIVTQVNEQLGTDVQVLTGDFGSMEFEPESFDLIVGKAFLHHLTHDLEAVYLSKAAGLLRRNGEARFFEPAVNSQILDKIRWMVPVPGRPSILNKKAFLSWKENDPHPSRDNSTRHYQDVGLLYFDEVKVVLIGSIERLCRLLPPGNFNRRFRRWAHRVEPSLPHWFRYSAARSQLILYGNPRN